MKPVASPQSNVICKKVLLTALAGNAQQQLQLCCHRAITVHCTTLHCPGTVRGADAHFHTPHQLPQPACIHFPLRSCFTSNRGGRGYGGQGSGGGGWGGSFINRLELISKDFSPALGNR